MKENLCVTSGCLGNCCENISIYETEEQCLKRDPLAKEVSVWKMAEILGEEVKDGTYYLYDGRSDEPGMVQTRIVGPCVRRLPTGYCSIYGRCGYAAEKFQFGSEQCNLIRKDHDLSVINNALSDGC